jgi:bifunctional non-homologous end joining protein LigD
MAKLKANAVPVRPAELPHWIKPQLTRLVDEPPDGPDWLHEIKFDGYRMHARLDRGAVRLLTRTGLIGRTSTRRLRRRFRRYQPSKRISTASCAASDPTALRRLALSKPLLTQATPTRWCSSFLTCSILTVKISNRRRSGQKRVLARSVIRSRPSIAVQ